MTSYNDLENTPPPCDGERAVTVNPTIKDIVAAYLKASGYDGLYNTTGDCGCELADLFACGGNDCDCQAGYKVPCDGETCPAFGDCDWHIAAEKPDRPCDGNSPRPRMGRGWEGEAMSEIKLPLPRSLVSSGLLRSEVVRSDAVATLERAYAELQERHNKMCEAHDRAESERYTAIGKQAEMQERCAQVEKERDEARQKMNWPTAVVVGEILNGSLREEALAKERDEARAWQLAVADAAGYVNYAEGQAGVDIAPAAVLIADIKKTSEELDALRAEVARLKRAKVELRDLVAQVEAMRFALDAPGGRALRVQLESAKRALDPDGEVKP